MAKINILNSELIPKIAAGEVVERPASVVKELVENAVDAGAENILVEIEAGGSKKIRVVDDGEGMDEKDLLLCFLPHATSKIRELSDLEIVRTFGFRGEALSTISAVSDVDIRSSLAGQSNGLAIEIRNARVGKPKPVGMSQGTIVQVSNLFSHHPARKKYLKSDSQEYQRILNMVITFALGNPKIGFELYRDGKKVFQVTLKDNLFSRVKKLLGQEMATHMLKVNFALPHAKVEGLISKPQLASAASADEQFLFVNTRAIKDTALAKTIKSAYKTLLDVHTYPPFILYIELDPTLVDVNVHPRKEKVKFLNEALVKELLHKAVTQVLTQNDLTYSYGKENDFRIDKKALYPVYADLKATTSVWQVRDKPKGEYPLTFQIADTYIAYPEGNSLILVDQHAAHESILYDEYLAAVKNKAAKSAVVELKKPLIIELPISSRAHFLENLDYLKSFGFSIEKFGEDAIKVFAVPAVFKNHAIKNLIVDLLTNATDQSTQIFTDAKTNQTIAYLSCRTAIKAGDILSEEEQKRLLLKLDECSELYTCPHGRPIKIRMSSSELARLFKRIK